MLTVALPWFISIPWWSLLVIYLLYFLTKGLGSEIGAHRYWSHRSFKTSRLWEKIMIILDTFSGEGSIIAFSGVHRLHHAHSDTDRDPHNPATHPWATTFYQHNTSEFGAKVVKDLLRDPWLVWQHKNYFRIQAAAIIVLALVSWLALWFYCVNVLVTLFINWLVDVACHTWGTNDHQLSNHSRNNRWADVVLLGVGLHNNHHADPANYRNNWGGRRFDLWGNIINFIKIG